MLLNEALRGSCGLSWVHRLIHSLVLHCAVNSRVAVSLLLAWYTPFPWGALLEGCGAILVAVGVPGGSIPPGTGRQGYTGCCAGGLLPLAQRRWARATSSMITRLQVKELLGLSLQPSVQLRYWGQVAFGVSSTVVLLLELQREGASWVESKEPERSSSFWQQWWLVVAISVCETIT